MYYTTNTLQIYRLNSTIPNFVLSFFKKFLIPIFNRGGAVRSERAERAETAERIMTAEKKWYPSFSVVSFVPFVSVVLRCDVRELSPSKNMKLLLILLRYFLRIFPKFSYLCKIEYIVDLNEVYYVKFSLLHFRICMVIVDLRRDIYSSPFVLSIW